MLEHVKRAERPAMKARLLLSGPAGAGKTWTALTLASFLADGDMSSVLVIDTEAESALTYADHYPGFGHLAWLPPYDPARLAAVLAEVDDPWRVVIVDSISHFWRGPGGTLDLSGGKFGGWAHARPVQERMLAAMLHVRAHLICCARSKMAYAVDESGRNVTKLGMEPIQDDGLPYEVNVAAEMDLDHVVWVTKSRCPAVPVGARFGPDEIERLAVAYGEWLAGGVPPADREVVAEIVKALNGIADESRRRQVKQDFVARFGHPNTLTANRQQEALEWALAT